MKKVLALVLGLVLLASCSATRKATKANESQLDSTAVVKEVTEQTEKVVDTTRTEHGKVTITEIEFYPPTTIEQPQGELAKDSGKRLQTNQSQPNHNRHPSQRQVLIWTISVRCKAWSSP